jgi:hypothetical protein
VFTSLTPFYELLPRVLVSFSLIMRRRNTVMQFTLAVTVPSRPLPGGFQETVLCRVSAPRRHNPLAALFRDSKLLAIRKYWERSFLKILFRTTEDTDRYICILLLNQLYSGVLHVLEFFFHTSLFS